MATIFSGLKLAQIVARKNPLLLYAASRNLAGWNKDFAPGKMPQTEEERLAAAKKYYMLPEEYRPYADDGNGLGDYPNIEGGLGIEAKDCHYPYTHPEHKRNLHETMMHDIVIYSEDRYSQPYPLRYPMYVYWATFLGIMTFCYVFYAWLDNHKMFLPVAAKQYPGEGKKHYLFEPEN